MYERHLLRRSFRNAEGRPDKETLANLSALPPGAIAAIRAVLAGKTLVPQMNDPAQTGKGFALTQVRRGGGGGGKAKAKAADPNATAKQKSKAGPGFVGYSLRTDRYRYTEWDEGKQGLELYDHEKDPHEFTNLAKDPQQAETAKQLSAKLHELTKPIP